jgi:hypothetical protein
MGGFGMPSRQAENGFVPAWLCFVGGARDETKVTN